MRLLERSNRRILATRTTGGTVVPGRTTRMTLLPALSVALTLLAAACSGAGDESGLQTRWTAAVDTVGDTVIVRTISG